MNEILAAIRRGFGEWLRALVCDKHEF